MAQIPDGPYMPHTYRYHTTQTPATITTILRHPPVRQRAGEAGGGCGGYPQRAYEMGSCVYNRKTPPTNLTASKERRAHSCQPRVHGPATTRAECGMMRTYVPLVYGRYPPKLVESWSINLLRMPCLCAMHARNRGGRWVEICTRYVRPPLPVARRKLPVASCSLFSPHWGPERGRGMAE